MKKHLISSWVILGICLLLACSSNSTDAPSAKELVSLGVYELSMGEPSGLSYDSTSQSLWVVGNNPQRIYQIDFQGNTLDTIDYNGNDMEGVVFNPADSSFWVVEERERDLVQVNMDGDELQRKTFNTGNEENSGLEGVTITAAGDLFILNEKNPGLFLALNDNLEVARQLVLDFADDYSGIVYDEREQGFWIVSDQESEVYLWREIAGVVETYEFSFRKAEGVAINAAGDRMYIVSDTPARLYVFSLEE